ncbi:MAG: MOSC domain-containing protein, partial [Spirochaetales bacterium]|nr:MOSC domain-containing protein [Spirochaetales bacterium]MCF7939461.1 MOSC domain-containing protein [Spirochaetales bacterium]
MTGEFSVIGVSLSPERGVQKQQVEKIKLIRDYGVEGDGHAGGPRQVSLLADEDVDIWRAKGYTLGPGDFADNITTRGVELVSLPIGTRLRLGEALLEITQIGKDCEEDSVIYHVVEDCFMPERGVYARVLEGGEVSSE